MKSVSIGCLGSAMLTRRTATVTISAPDASTAAAFSSKLLYLPVPTISRERKVRPATVQLSASMSCNAFTCFSRCSATFTRPDMGLGAVPAKLLFTLALLASQAAPPVKGDDVVVQSSAARPAIHRILEADNLDVDRLPADEVAARMQEIRRGVAPIDFWAAYQDHVRAWTDYAEAKARARRSDPLQVDNAPDGRAIAA